MGLFSFIRKTMHPAAYHGQGQKPPFFEGWYFKMVSPGQRAAYTLIPGIYQAVDPARSHAFIQVMDGRTGRTAYYTFPAGAFHAVDGRLELDLAGNRFSESGLRVDLTGGEIEVRGEVRHAGFSPWPVTGASPGIMGWYAWVPFMECYHGVVSLDHALEGHLAVDGRALDLTGGRGYIEKDWGRSFPRAWVWMQSNHFDTPGTSLTASIAIIPWLGSAFNGFIIGLWHGGRLYRFATYTGARVETLSISSGAVVWVVSNRRYRLEILARREEGGLLRAPTTVEMDRRIAETLNSEIEVRLLEKRRGGEQLLFHEKGGSAGLEVVGDPAALSGG